MIEKIASSLPVQGRSLDVTAPIPEGKGFAEELAATTKTAEVKTQGDDPQEDKKNGCCSNDDGNSPPGTPFTSSQEVK